VARWVIHLVTPSGDFLIDPDFSQVRLLFQHRFTDPLRRAGERLLRGLNFRQDVIGR